MNALNKKLEFVRHDKFGYLTYCPTNIGTGLRTSVHIHVPKLSENDLNDVCSKLDLQVRGWFTAHVLLNFFQNKETDQRFLSNQEWTANIPNRRMASMISRTKFA